MTERIMKFLNKNSIELDKVKYITREDKKTCIYLTDDRTVCTYITIKDLYSVLSQHDFICISKGIVVAKSQIKEIDHFDYHMNDGMIFHGRKRTAAAHRKLNESLILSSSYSKPLSVSDIRERFSVLDNMPVAFCVVELVFNHDGAGIDFIFRYCNKEMEILEGKTIEEMMNNSFCKVFPNADKKWFAAYTDVAINGVERHINDYSPEIDKDIYVRCFQPLEGFCACLLTPVEDLENALPATYNPAQS